MEEQRTFADGYLDGWRGVAGDGPPPPIPGPKTRKGETEFQTGFECGRAEALMRFKPSETT